MVRPTIEETRMLLFLTLTTLLILVFCGTTCFAPTANTASAATTPLKTYTYPTGFFTLQYPADWIVNETQPVTKFDRPGVTFISLQPRSVLHIEIKPSPVNSPMEFREAAYRYAYTFASHFPNTTVSGEGFGVYSIAGYDTYAFVTEGPTFGNQTMKSLLLTSRIGYQQMNIYFIANPESFNQQMPAVQKMIDSIKITGIR